MRTPLLLAVLVAALAACGGAVTGGGANPAGAGPGEPHDVASVRLFDSTGGELTFHMPLFDSVPLRVVVRMYAANGRYLTSVTGGQDMQFTFTPAGLASSTSVTGQRVAPRRRGAAGLSRVRGPLDGDGPRKRLSAIRPAIRHSGG